MWFDKSKRSESVAEEPQHWPSERMILEGHADYAIPEDLEGIDTSVLEDIAVLCEVDVFAPEACIPCLAHAMVLERRREAEEPNEPEEVIIDGEHHPIPGGHQHHLDDLPGNDRLPREFEDEEPQVIAPLLDLANRVQARRDGDPWHGEGTPEPEVPVAEVFAEKVEELRLLVSEMLDGPPIPPKNVSLADLALLTLAADKWVKMTEIQGGWGGEQQQMLDATKALVARLRP